MEVEHELASFQQAQLWRASEESGRVNDLLYYFAVLRDEAQLEALASRTMEGHPEDRLVYLLLQGESSAAGLDTVLALAPEVSDPWVHYTLVKYLLRWERFSDALAVAVGAMKRGGVDLLPFNMLARFACHAGHRDVARNVAERSLHLAPEQRDVAVFLEQIAAGTPPSAAPPCLDLLPPRHRVAYYLPCYKVEEYIAQTIEAVAGMCYPLEEILIIDDGSPDASVEIARQYPVRIVHHESNRGLSVARNTAWKSTQTEFLGTVDTDASPAPGYVKCALMEYEQGPPELAMIGGRLFEAYQDTPADEFRSLFMGQDPGEARAYQDDFLIREALDESGNFKANTGQFFVTGSDTLARRAALAAVGGYPERYRTNGEDAAVCQLLRSRGWHIAFTPSCVATHYRRDTVGSVLRTSWNYGFWFRTDSGFYNSLVGLITLLDDYCVAGHHFTIRAIEEKRTHLLYTSFLFAFYSMALDLAHGIELGLLSPGEALTIRQDLEGVVADLDERFGGNLAEKVRGDLPEWPYGPEIAPQALEPGVRHVLDNSLALLRDDQRLYTPVLYRLLLEH